MKKEDRPSGNCALCYQPRVQLSNGIWVCPSFYGSPMHMCHPPDWKRSNTGEQIDFHGYPSAQAYLEDYAGMPLEQYLEEVKDYPKTNYAEYYQSLHRKVSEENEM